MSDVEALHRSLSILQHVDVGLVVLDRDFRIQLWNRFMENHSGIRTHTVMGQSLFTMLNDIDEAWLRRKAESVFLLNNRSYVSWKECSHLTRFASYRPITSQSESMYQNLSIIPLPEPNGAVEHVCLIIYDMTDIALDEQALNNANDELERLSRTDGLTGLLNRRSWEEELLAEMKRSRRTRSYASLVIFDIDHFKRVNDNYGHPAGDEVIRSVSRKLQYIKRDTDIAGRYGGEEFTVILPDTDLAGARFFAERLRREVEKDAVNYEGEEIRYTISLGIAHCIEGDEDHIGWLNRSDQALYRSKEGGRNCVNVDGE